MVGKSRLDVFRRAVFEITLEGMVLEFGVFNGTTIKLLSKLLPDRIIYGFDSFEGLPDNWQGKYKQGTFNLRGIPPKVPSNVQLVKGRFEETLEPFLQNNSMPVAFVNFDADLYFSTKYALETLDSYGRLKTGTVLYFDEFITKSYSDEFRAFIEMGIPVRLISYWWFGNSYSSFAFKVL